MTSFAIYMEGGGDGGGTKAALRQGMEVFLAPLKEAVRAKSWRWKLVCCGGRADAFTCFRDAVRSGDYAIVALLVDAEGQVNNHPRAHLQKRDRWDLQFTSDEVVHLMVETMEAWIVADPDALQHFYGQGFRRSALPAAQNLETVARADIANALEQATRQTQRGPYHKIHHGSELLKRIERQKVRDRCPSCARMFDALGQVIEKT